MAIVLIVEYTCQKSQREEKEEKEEDAGEVNDVSFSLKFEQR